MMRREDSKAKTNRTQLLSSKETKEFSARDPLPLRPHLANRLRVTWSQIVYAFLEKPEEGAFVNNALYVQGQGKRVSNGKPLPPKYQTHAAHANMVTLKTEIHALRVLFTPCDLMPMRVNEGIDKATENAVRSGVVPRCDHNTRLNGGLIHHLNELSAGRQTSCTAVLRSVCEVFARTIARYTSQPKDEADQQFYDEVATEFLHELLHSTGDGPLIEELIGELIPLNRQSKHNRFASLKMRVKPHVVAANDGKLPLQFDAAFEWCVAKDFPDFYHGDTTPQEPTKCGPAKKKVAAALEHVLKKTRDHQDDLCDIALQHYRDEKDDKVKALKATCKSLMNSQGITYKWLANSLAKKFPAAEGFSPASLKRYVNKTGRVADDRLGEAEYYQQIVEVLSSKNFKSALNKAPVYPTAA